jgi:hydrogenase expression/formation protein HypE
MKSSIPISGLKYHISFKGRWQRYKSGNYFMSFQKFTIKIIIFDKIGITMQNIITLGHGSGGKMTSELIRNLFARFFSNPTLNVFGDSAILNAGFGKLAFTTDSYVIDPVFFPGGNIGKLAVCGTINDLAVAAARPLYMSAAFIIEEGFPVKQLEKIVKSMAETASEAGVNIVTGDTKVVKHGQCDKIYINTSGIGLIEDKDEHIASGKNICIGDKLLVNGFIGDHEICILAARENLQFEKPIESDVAPLNTMIKALLDADIEIKFMRDITRGGLATICAEITEKRTFGIEIEEQLLPVREETKGICELYGFDALYLANEGKVLAVISRETANQALEILKEYNSGKDAAIIGEITEEHHGKAVMKTITGGTRIIDSLAGIQLPRIC